jgi:hypothetical protein
MTPPTPHRHIEVAFCFRKEQRDSPAALLASILVAMNDGLGAIFGRRFETEEQAFAAAARGSDNRFFDTEVFDLTDGTRRAVALFSRGQRMPLAARTN